MKIPIVNEQDEIIWYKERSEVELRDIYRVSCLYIENPKWEVLLAQRWFLKTNAPGKWWPAVAGTVEEGESYESNIYKEAKEEIGLSWEMFTKWKKYRSTGKHQYFCQLYKLILDRDISEFIKEEWAVETIRWFTREELDNLCWESPEIFTNSTVKMIQGEI